MDKKQLHHIWTKFRLVKPWYFLVVVVIAAGVSIYALRQNNLKMVILRNDVYTADQNNTNVNQALKTLQAFVTSHMNTDLSGGPNAPYPPIQLEYTYARLQQADDLSASNVNQSLYTDAEYYCQKAIPNGFSGRYRVTCIEQYITDHGVSVQVIPPSLYEFNFVSPTWSPDLAGWSLVICIAALVLFLISFLSGRWLKYNSR